MEGWKLTRIRASAAQNRPDGDVEPPRIGSPLTIFPVATLLALASAATQLEKSPALEFWIRPLLPYTNRYGWITTQPPETAMLLSNVAVIVPVAVAAADMVTAVPTTDSTVVPEGMPVPVMAWPAPTRTLFAANVNVVLVMAVAPDAVNTPTLDMVRLPVEPGNSPYSTGVFTVEVM